MQKIGTLKVSENWIGVDFNKETSLLEYGFLWNEETSEVIYMVSGWNEDFDQKLSVKDNEVFSFDNSTFTNEDANSLINKSWFDKESFLNTCGISETEWLETWVPSKLCDLLSYYGTDNVLGTSYYPGALINYKAILSK